MKTLLLFLAVLCTAYAQSPRMSVREADGTVKILSIEEADIKVRILGDVAETVIELNFRNDGSRVAEGEFVLPLPEGATVSGYALEVNGEMREAVSVEKQRARTAYETVKNRKIDPGIVEREAGNIYRTQIYPIPARGTKRLRISYTETFQETYSLPLDFPDPVKSFTLKVVGKDLEVIAKAGLDLTERKEGDLIEAKMESFEASGTLKVKPGDLDENPILLDEGEQPAFMVSILPPELAPRERRAPRSVALVWDASGSGIGRDHAEELALLDAWFAKLGAVSVKLFTLRNTMGEAGAFEVQGGKWDKLRKTLESLDYDGGTDFSQVAIPGGTADLTLFVGDGVASIGQAAPRITGPWFFIHPGSSGGQLAHLAVASGGDEIALSGKGIKSGLAKLTQASPRLVSVTGNSVRTAIIGEPLVRGKRMHVFGMFREKDFGSIELGFGYGDEIVEKQTVGSWRIGDADRIVGRLHAQRMLAEMERRMPVDSDAIIAHCKDEGLVSDFTSFIVLERIEDYAQHGIRPPESGLWAEYDKLVARFGNNDSARFEWRNKIEWHRRSFPGYEAILLPRMKQVGIWKSAVEKQFKPEQRDAEAFGVIAGWYDKGIALMEQIPAIRTQEEYDKWRKEIDALHKQGPQLAATPLHAPPAGKELAVSVRGLVTEPGVITSEKPLTLRGAIAEAGKLHAVGSLDNVALYRNAGKAVYNTLSEKFEDFPLYPMDMVVIGTKFPDPYGNVDPFSARDSTQDNPAAQPAIREQEDVWVDPRPGDIGPLGLFSPGSGNRPSGRRVIADANFSDEIPDAAQFKKQLAAGADPVSAYQKHRGKVMRQQQFYVDSARILFENKQDALAMQVLSNLAETRPGDVSALRAWAFWLAEFGKTHDAEKVLEGIAPVTDADPLVAMDLAALRTARGGSRVAYLKWTDTMGQTISDSLLASIALTDFNSLRDKVGKSGDSDPFSDYRSRFSNPLPADIRIVVTSSDEATQPSLAVIEPSQSNVWSDWNSSPHGGRLTASRGVSEYMIRRALPGKYRIECRTNTPITVRLTIHKDWGRPNQTTRTLTFFSDPTISKSVAELDFPFRPAK